MKRKKIIRSFLVVMMCVFISACNQETKDVKKEKEVNKESEVGVIDNKEKAMDIAFDENGVAFNVPEKWLESDGRKIILNFEELGDDTPGQIILGYISEETINKIDKMREESNNIPDTDTDSNTTSDLEKEVKDLCRIISIDKSMSESDIKKELFDKYDIKYLIGEADNLEFYLLFNVKPNTEGLTEASKNDYLEFYSEIETFKSLIKVYKPTTETEKVSKNKLEFSTVTLDGNEIDSSIIEENKLTMVNIWGTFCQPCIDEMPDLQSLYEEVKEDEVNLIGIIADTPDKEIEELAKRIVSTKGVNYTNLIPDELIISNVLNNISAVPTTLFVDQAGNIISDLVVGARSKEEYKNEIEKRLEMINN